MKLVRYQAQGEAAIGLVDGDTVSEVEFDRQPDAGPDIVQAAQADDLRETGVEHALADVHVDAPVPPRQGKIVCLGLNYAEHAERGGNPIPDEPLLFAKPTSAIIGPTDDVVFPSDAEQLDYEAELAIVIGKAGRRVPREEAVDHIAGYTVFNDVSARDVQYRFSQYFRGKGYDTFAPLGPTMVTPDEVDPTDLSIRALVNDEVRQDSSTADMIFPVDEVVESVTQTMTLYPGDVVATGTPPGVGVHRDPPLLLEEGDEVTIEVEDVGALRNTIVAEEE
ncbi:MAG: fumarylacetoacetate hydrolase family protein [Halobacteriota archaeon]